MPPFRKFASRLRHDYFPPPYPPPSAQNTTSNKTNRGKPTAVSVNPSNSLILDPRTLIEHHKLNRERVNTREPPPPPPLFPSSFDLKSVAPHIQTQSLLETLEKSLAKGTRRNYESAVKTFLNYCDREGVLPEFCFPADERVLCAFAASMAKQLLGSTASGIISGLKLWHTTHNKRWQGSPRLSLILKGVAADAPKSSTRPQRDPVTPEMLVLLCKETDHNDPKSVAVLAAALVAFWGQCRLGEILGTSSLRFDSDALPARTAISIADDGDNWILKLPRTKTERINGQSVIILRQHDPIDPIKALENHLRVNADIDSATHLFAFRAKDGESIRCLTGEVLLDFCNNVWSRHGFDRITGHAFRIGGTTTLLRNKVAPEVVRELGRWSSDAFFRYWRDTHSIAAIHARLLPNIEKPLVPPPSVPGRRSQSTGRDRSKGLSVRRSQRLAT